LIIITFQTAHSQTEFNTPVGVFPEISTAWKLSASGSLIVNATTLIIIKVEDNLAKIQSQDNLRLEPLANAIISMATVVEFDDYIGDRLRFYSTAYKIGISSFDLDYTSDLWHKWHSDTNDDAMRLNGDTGDLYIEGSFYGDGSNLTGISFAYTELTGNPSDVITAGDYIDWAGNTLNVSMSWTDITNNPSTAITAGDYIDWDGDTLDVVPVWLPLDGSIAMTGDLDMGGRIITNLDGFQLNAKSTLTGLAEGTWVLYAP